MALMMKYGSRLISAIDLVTSCFIIKKWQSFYSVAMLVLYFLYSTCLP